MKTSLICTTDSKLIMRILFHSIFRNNVNYFDDPCSFFKLMRSSTVEFIEVYMYLSYQSGEDIDEMMANVSYRNQRMHAINHAYSCTYFFHSFPFWLQIAREMVISPRNSRLGLTSLVKRVGMMDRPDSAESELIKYKVLLALIKINIFFTSYLNFWVRSWLKFVIILN